MATRSALDLGLRRRWTLARRLTASEDAAHGASNPVSRPRAGNISSDSRAGL